MTDQYLYTCPHCSHDRLAADVAREIPAEILRQVTVPMIGRLRRRNVAGPGRPQLARCPGCSQEMTSSDLREHRIPCVRQELQRLIGRAFRLSPKDPDRYPDFYLHFLPDDADSVELRKASSGDNVSIDSARVNNFETVGERI